MDIKIAYNSPIEAHIDDLNAFQGDLKELSGESYHKLSTEIMETGFAFAPHIWINPKDKKLYLIDGHQRISVVKRLIEEGHKIKKIPVIPVFAKTFQDAKKRILQATSQYGRITNQGLANFATEAKIDISDLLKSFELPNFDFNKFQEQFIDAGKLVDVAAHARAVGMVNKGDESSEWSDMPEFKAGEGYLKIILHFKTEAGRDKYIKKNRFKIDKKIGDSFIMYCEGQKKEKKAKKK